MFLIFHRTQCDKPKNSRDFNFIIAPLKRYYSLKFRLIFCLFTKTEKNNNYCFSINTQSTLNNTSLGLNICRRKALIDILNRKFMPTILCCLIVHYLLMSPVLLSFIFMCLLSARSIEPIPE